MPGRRATGRTASGVHERWTAGADGATFSGGFLPRGRACGRTHRSTCQARRASWPQCRLTCGACLRLVRWPHPGTTLIGLVRMAPWGAASRPICQDAARPSDLPRGPGPPSYGVFWRACVRRRERCPGWSCLDGPTC